MQSTLRPIPGAERFQTSETELGEGSRASANGSRNTARHRRPASSSPPRCRGQHPSGRYEDLRRQFEDGAMQGSSSTRREGDRPDKLGGLGQHLTHSRGESVRRERLGNEGVSRGVRDRRARHEEHLCLRAERLYPPCEFRARHQGHDNVREQ